MTFSVKLFTTARGDSPVKDFLDSLDKPTLTSGLHELRTSGQTAVRILFANYQGTYHLLHAFKKQTQKTPLKEIQTALDRKAKLI
ncbi:hypothetical protein A3D85_00500 [Candidatus Amesbacteria bacterium RIFCSPHIGHO2_02_FULL_47_9]|uniref:Addiction module toxin RelE n=1 Tax=Candidatus Amesbacteria bacterium RIFCSPHIGHO2_01_FULL_48_32b TaxID=1797253 RepID=A0A1F4YDP6_9BACT|nr:MAG: hypothetical protein A2876_01690 [Candidatus Amesbacteria bacterium RIFCSPHIGHO2_01_FULL_48_32b]OGD04904.1 MAG: hypothetical protein A3D85_00500 [Candidatus Amesbacteria bacterium RIFCSPHIGHO2_02_FULL_47_9]OGD07277.1 MAG: hypothetical protein A2899_04710 [Candidatus Amesbacteria bacterium RIFCSPLOWO2_01_FULL_49_25]